MAASPLVPVQPAAELLHTADRPRYSVPGSITADGSRDVSAALQSFIDRVPDGSTIVFPRDATYLLGGHGLTLLDRHRLVVVGYGATLHITGCTERDSAFYVGGSSRYITIRGFDIVGDNRSGGTSAAFRPGCEYAHGVLIAGAQDVSIARVHVSRVFGDCLYLGIGSSGQWASGVWFHDSRCALNGTPGSGGDGREAVAGRAREVR